MMQQTDVSSSRSSGNNRKVFLFLFFLLTAEERGRPGNVYLQDTDMFCCLRGKNHQNHRQQIRAGHALFARLNTTSNAQCCGDNLLAQPGRRRAICRRNARSADDGGSTTASLAPLEDEMEWDDEGIKRGGSRDTSMPADGGAARSSPWQLRAK